MKRTQLLVVGGGPAGLAAAALAAQRGVETMLVDEQPRPGGQIYRSGGFTSSTLDRLLGESRRHGAELVTAFEHSGAVYRPRTSVWHLDPDGEAGLLVRDAQGAGASETIRAERIVLATGAMERPVAFAGWTLPGVMNAGAAQILLKSSALVPEGRVVLAGSGPLLLLVATQILEAGGRIAALLETAPRNMNAAALRRLPRAGRGWREIARGIGFYRYLQRRGVPVHFDVDGLVAEGTGALGAVCWQSGGVTHRLPADLLLVHFGVIPVTHATRAIGADHVWDQAQQAWRPRLDEFGATSVSRYAVAGDAGGIGGAQAAEVSGRLVALDAAARLGPMSRDERDRLAAPLHKKWNAATAVRPLLDALYPPPAFAADPADDIVVCRCEGVTAARIREAARRGCTGPNQLKAFTRCGMGPCQGRQCGPVVQALIAAVHGRPIETIPPMRVRPPLRALSVGDLARIARADSDEAY